MNKKPIHLGWCDVFDRAEQLAERLHDSFKGSMRVKLFGVKPDGVYATLAIMGRRPADFIVVEDPVQSDVIVDGVIYGGVPRHVHQYCVTHYFPRPYVALVDVTGRDSDWRGHPVIFPWYRDRLLDTMLADQIKRIEREILDGHSDQQRVVPACPGERTGGTQPA